MSIQLYCIERFHIMSMSDGGIMLYVLVLTSDQKKGLSVDNAHANASCKTSSTMYTLCFVVTMAFIMHSTVLCKMLVPSLRISAGIPSMSALIFLTSP